MGCLQVCLSCTAFCATVTSSSFVKRLQDLAIILNSLPTSCLPDFLLNIAMNERSIRAAAQELPRSLDHGNLAGSALMLVLLRPHLYMDNPVPLRLLGYPPPVEYLVEDKNPHSSGGPDNKRTNLVEALCAYWYQSSQAGRFTTFVPQCQSAFENALIPMQEAWHMMRIKVDIALRSSKTMKVNAHAIVAEALQVEDNAVMG